jgi:hypothetical protein
LISDQKAKDKAVILQIRISPKQAERLERVYRIFRMTQTFNSRGFETKADENTRSSKASSLSLSKLLWPT